MADQRSVMKEYRLLEQKRQAGGLTPQEEARLAQLRDLVGPETGVAAARPGFDVNAAAARLRESLLPAGLRNRPPPDPAATPLPLPPEPEPALTPAAGLEAVWSAAPFAPLTEQPAAAEEALFDPGTLGLDGAQAYDPSAPQQWDPNAQPYDPDAPQQWDAGAAQGWDAGAQGYDPNTQPYDPNTQPYDPNAQPYDPNAPQQWDAGAAQGWDAGAQGYDPNAQPWDPNAVPQWDAAVQPAWDPNLAPPWDGQAGELPLGASLEVPAGEPSAEPAPEPEWSAEGAPTEPIPEPAIEPAAPPPGEEGAWDVSAFPAELEPAPEVEWSPEAEAAAEPAPAVEWTEPAEEPPVEATVAPEAEPFAATAEPAAELAPESASALPFDADAASALEPSANPEGWGGEEPSVEVDLAAPEPSLATGTDGYGDLAGPEEPSLLDALPAGDAGGLLAPLGAGQELTSDDDAFAQGFHLESNGSFGQEPAQAAPAWDAALVPAEGEPWESAPALDLGAMAPASDVPPLDLGPPPAQPSPARSAPAVPLEEVEVEEIPVVEGTDLLEEIPPPPVPFIASPPARAPAADLRPSVPPPPAPAADVRVEGAHRVVVHTVEGLVKRGVIADVSLDAAALPLMPQPDATPEQLSTAKVKAIFFMLAAGEKPPVAEGKRVRVTFNDGRQIAGFSPDYSDAGAGFFMIPADTRTNTGRIWVYRAAVKTVSVS